MKHSPKNILLGIDTGGTYTDAVLFSHEDGVVAKAKSVTTRHDLSIGISGALETVLKNYDGKVSEVSLVSISTTLATNALVEGKGEPVALIMIGFDRGDMENAGLKESLGSDPVVFLPGGHDVYGNEQPLDLKQLAPFVREHAPNVSGFAVAGYFAVRNASHEIRVRDFLLSECDLPVTCSHELSTKLGGPKRALTTLLNARLIPVIRDLVLACRDHLREIGINAPLMVVRGDGALIDADFALRRPIETILSGPAASLVGAKFLLGAEDAIVSDIGGTTTDVAILEKGWPRTTPEGASVGGYKTMVDAVAMHTFGLGGDSAVSIEETNGTKIVLGPRRQIPVSLLAMSYPAEVLKELERQAEIEFPGNMAARFAHRLPDSGRRVGGLKASETKLYERLNGKPQALDTLLKRASEAGTLNRLVSRGLVEVSGFTPSDAMHVLGLQNNWNDEAASLAASIICRTRDRFGQTIADSPQALCRTVKKQLTVQSCDVIIRTAMNEDGIPVGPDTADLVSRALEENTGFVNFSLALDRILVGLGASASTYYPEIGKRLKSEWVVPEHADVANAIGAVAGEVRVQKTLVITSPDGGNTFHLNSSDGLCVFANEDEVMEKAGSALKTELEILAHEAGAADPVFVFDASVDAPYIEGKRHFVEAKITGSASGRPRITPEPG